jgi:hypothetical protein
MLTVYERNESARQGNSIGDYSELSLFQASNMGKLGDERDMDISAKLSESLNFYKYSCNKGIFQIFVG